MAYFPVHAVVGAGIGIISQGNPVGYPLALWSHLPLDLLNQDWYHEYGEGRIRYVFGAFIALVSIAVVLWILMIRRDLLLFAFFACLPDIEHPFRWLFGKKQFYIHGANFLSHPIMRTRWGMVGWMIWWLMVVVAGLPHWWV